VAAEKDTGQDHLLEGVYDDPSGKCFSAVRRNSVQGGKRLVEKTLGGFTSPKRKEKGERSSTDEAHNEETVY